MQYIQDIENTIICARFYPQYINIASPVQLLRASVRIENVPGQRAEHRDGHERLVANIGRARGTRRRGHRYLGVEVAIVRR